MFLKGKDGGGPRWIVAFLGNPESKYERTRHNAGFMAAAVLESKRGIKTNKLKFHAFTNIAEFGGERVLFMRPQTYMNRSGDAVAPAAAFYKIPAERIIVVFEIFQHVTIEIVVIIYSLDFLLVILRTPRERPLVIGNVNLVRFIVNSFAEVRYQLSFAMIVVHHCAFKRNKHEYHITND